MEAPQILRHRIDLAQHPVFCFFLFPGRVLGHSRARQAMGMCWHVCSPSFSDVFDSSTFTSCSHIFAKCIRREYVEHTEATNPERDPCVMPFLRSSGRRNRRSFPSPRSGFSQPMVFATPGLARLCTFIWGERFRLFWPQQFPEVCEPQPNRKKDTQLLLHRTTCSTEKPFVADGNTEKHRQRRGSRVRVQTL